MLVCMTRNFDVIHEEPLRSEDFGQGASTAALTSTLTSTLTSARQIHQRRLGIQVDPVPRLSRQIRRPPARRPRPPSRPPDRPWSPRHLVPRRRRLLRRLVARPLPRRVRPGKAPGQDIRPRRLVRFPAQTVSHLGIPARPGTRPRMATEREPHLHRGPVRLPRRRRRSGRQVGCGHAGEKRIAAWRFRAERGQGRLGRRDGQGIGVEF